MSISYLLSTWTPTSLAAQFDHYEIQRSQDGQATWDQVANISTEAVDQYRDYEPVRETAAHYRLRVARTDGALSDWTAVQTEQTPASGWAFVSNEAPHLNREQLVWSDTAEAHRWGFDANEKEYEIAGRDGAVVLKGLEDRLDTFNLAVLVSDAAHDNLGREVADELEALSKATLSYVCVHSPESRRWLANVTFSQMEQDEDGQVYTLPGRVRELTNVPSIVDVAAV